MSPAQGLGTSQAGASLSTTTSLGALNGTSTAGSQPTAQLRARLLQGNRHAKPLDAAALAKLDGSIKRNTAFVKKLKLLTAEQLPALIREMEGLKLEKYLEEIATVLAAEARLKTHADILAALELCCLLHQRFAAPAFLQLLVDLLLRQLGGLDPKGLDPARLPRLRSSLRLLTELYLVGILHLCMSARKADALLLDLLVPLVAPCKGEEEFPYLPLLVTFVKGYRDQFAGSPEGEQAEQGPLMPESAAREVRELCIAYTRRLHQHLVAEDKRIKRLDHQNTEATINRGLVNAEREERLERATARFEKVHSQASTLSAALGLEMPVLEGAGDAAQPASILVDQETGRDDKDFSQSVWEDEEAKAFYTNLPDLRNFVPGLLLGQQTPTTSKGGGAEGGSGAGAGSSPSRSASAAPLASTSVEPEARANQPPAVRAEPEGPSAEAEDGAEPAAAAATAAEEDAKLMASMPANTAAALEALLLLLPACMSREAVDKLAQDFAFLNSKATRRRLARALLTVSRHQVDLLPYYCRLLAILHPFMPDITAAVVAQADANFRSDVRRKKQDFHEDKVKNVRYLAELVKFDLLPHHLIYHALKVLLDDFNSHNVEMLCALLEGCGRFLYRSSVHAERFKGYMTIMLRKKAAVASADARQGGMLDYAYYLCNPPSAPALTLKERTPLELYLRHCFYAQLHPRTAERLLTTLCRLDWSKPDTRTLVRKFFVRPWKVRFANLQSLAYLLAGLIRYYPAFGIEVVDHTLEEVRAGLEQNLFRHNQRRIATIRFLGELFLYRLLTSHHVFESLYLLLRFGHEQGIPRPGFECPLDLSHDFFRVRLVCALLDTVGHALDKGPAKQKLDHFLLFLQVYLFAKERPPQDIEFLLAETLDAVAPRMVVYGSFEEAVDALNRVHASSHGGQEVTAASGTSASNLPQDQEGEEDDLISMQEGEQSEGPEDQSFEALADGASGDEGTYDEREAEDEGPGQQDAVVIFQEEEVVEDDLDDLDFEREYRQMMVDSLESRKQEARPASGSGMVAALPSQGLSFLGGAKAGIPVNTETGHVKFSLLTKRGNKPALRDMELPADSTLAISTRAHLERQQLQNQDIKQRVLHLEQVQADESRSLAAAQLFPLLGGAPETPEINMVPGLENVGGSRRVRRVLYSRAAPSSRGSLGGKR